jgi:DNA modification methylase
MTSERIQPMAPMHGVVMASVPELTLPQPYYQDDSVTIYHGDCQAILPLVNADAVVSDPPYGIDYNPTRSQNSAASGARKKLAKVKNDNVAFDPTPLLRFKKLILWGANNYAAKLPASHGWFIWDKREGGTLFPGFVASDAELAWTNVVGRTLVFSHRWCGHLRDSERNEYWHPTQKPVALMCWCLGHIEAETILDPYMGSGTTLVAAKREGRKAIGIELEEKYCETAAKRLAQGVLF